MNRGRFIDVKRSAISIQCAVREPPRPSLYEVARAGRFVAQKLAAWYKVKLSRRTLEYYKIIITRLQAVYRMHYYRKLFIFKKISATLIASRFRGHIIRSNFNKRKILVDVCSSKEENKD